MNIKRRGTAGAESDPGDVDPHHARTQSLELHDEIGGSRQRVGDAKRGRSCFAVPAKDRQFQRREQVRRAAGRLRRSGVSDSLARRIAAAKLGLSAIAASVATIRGFPDGTSQSPTRVAQWTSERDFARPRSSLGRVVAPFADPEAKENAGP